MWRSLILAAVAMGIMLCPAVSRSEMPQAKLKELERLFLYSDLVVDGVVEKITTHMVPHERLVPGIRGPSMRVAIIAFRVNSVLVGYPQPEHIEIGSIVSQAYHTYFDLEEGDRYILALRYICGRENLFLNEKYVTGDIEQKFFVKDCRWFQGRKGQSLAEGELNDLVCVAEEAARKRSIEYLTRQADAIVQGRVADLAEHNEHTDRGLSKHINRITFAVDSIMKGDIRENLITISMITVGLYSPWWRMPAPDMHIGEEWIAFLKWAEEPGYYPFAGVNGLFLVKDNSLIRNRSIAIGITKNQLEIAIGRILAAGE